MKYEPILILDEDDTPWNDLLSLKEFYDMINYHIESFNEKPENVFIRISTQVYDEDTVDSVDIGQILFLVKKDS